MPHNTHTSNTRPEDIFTTNTDSQHTGAQTVSRDHDVDHAGRWYVAAFSEALAPGRTVVKTIADQEIVLWRALDDDGPVQAASAVCPHWGGPLGGGAVDSSGVLTCPWHGWQFRNGYCLERPRLKLFRYLAHDDGILLWVRLPWDIEEITAPPLQARPAQSKAFWFDVAIQSDVYHVQENYLDFLHPAEYHHTVFNHCVYLGKEGDVHLVELGYKLPFGRSLTTRTRVWAPTPFQVRNEVYEGLGQGTVIESHITPLGADRAIIHEIYHVPEAVTPGQAWPLMRFFMRRSARRIRVEDAVFSARRYRLRKLGFVDGRGLPIQGKVAPYLDEWGDSPAGEEAAEALESLMGKTAPSHH
jgi:nitrite reductase/ring-hydroxylating ferredoxin subunit